MDQESYDATQQGLLLCLLEEEHESRLIAFLEGLRNDPHWSESQIDSIEATLREVLHAERPRKSTTDNGSGQGHGSPLSRREQEVIRLMARGHTGKEIASQFELSAKTVETYKARAMTKLGLATRADIVRYAKTRGWL